jgi:four helix bundle protein
MKLEEIYDIEDRLVRFSGEVIKYIKTLPKDDVGLYLRDQIIRSACSAALHYGEVQGTYTTKDSVNKLSMVLKELKDTRVSLRIAQYSELSTTEHLNWILSELEEVIAIVATIRKNKTSSSG